MNELQLLRIRKARVIARSMGGQARLCESLGVDPSMVSALIGKNPRDTIGFKLARRIEAAGGHAHGWLDTEGEVIDMSAMNLIYLTESVAVIQEQIKAARPRLKLDSMAPEKLALLIQTAYGMKSDSPDTIDHEVLSQRMEGIVALMG